MPNAAEPLPKIPKAGAAFKPGVKPEKPPRKSFFIEYYVVGFLFLIAGFAAVALLVHRPLIQQVKKINALTQSQLQATDNERTYLKSLEASVSAAQSIPAEVLEEVDNALPAEQNIPSLLVQLGSSAYRNNARIDSIVFNEAKSQSQGGVPAAGLIMPMDINLSVRAPNYFEFKRFLADLESSLRIMDISTLTSSGGTNELSYMLQLKTYSYIPPPVKTVTRPMIGSGTSTVPLPNMGTP